jgi:pimeloyl-ACP methyl ester carboxylesterase
MKLHLREISHLKVQIGLRTGLIAVLAIIVLLLPQTASAQGGTPLGGSTPSGSFSPAACMFDLPSGIQEGRDVSCGYLTVPADYNNPGGPTIELAVVILKSKSATPKPDPIFFAQGGPGGSTIDTYTKLLLPDNPFTNERDVVLWDQRGTLKSKPFLRCSEFLDETIKTLDQQLTDAQDETLSLQATTACHDRLTQNGVDLSNFNSLENAADIEALRTALGYGPINYYGVSYGTLLGLHYLNEYPDNLRSLVLDAVVPPQVNFLTESGQALNKSLEHLFTTCAADPVCNQEYPQLKQVFYDLVRQLNDQPAQIQITDTDTYTPYPTLMTGDLFLSTIFQLLYPSDYIPLLPKIIYAAKGGDFSLLADAILPLIIFDRTISDGMYLSVICSEDADYTPQQINVDGLPPELAQSEQHDMQVLLKMCQDWEVTSLSPAIDNPVQGDVPALLLSGEFDPITPPAYAALVAETLPNSHQITFPSGGHGQVLGGECQNQIMLAFLNQPDRTPDTTCVPASISFLTSQDYLEVPLTPLLFSRDVGGLFKDIFWFGLLMLASFALFSAVVFFPARWITLRRKSPQVSTEELPPLPAGEPQFASRLVKLAPWLAFLAGLILAGLLAAFWVISSQLITDNNVIVFFGFPKSTWPIFLLPWVFLALTIGMLVCAFILWIRADKSLLYRIYYSIITLAALVGIAALLELGLYAILFG